MVAYVNMFCSGMELIWFSICKGNGRLIVIIYIEWEYDRTNEFWEEVVELDCFFGCVDKDNVLSFYGW